MPEDRAKPSTASSGTHLCDQALAATASLARGRPGRRRSPARSRTHAWLQPSTPLRAVRGGPRCDPQRVECHPPASSQEVPRRPVRPREEANAERLFAGIHEVYGTRRDENRRASSNLDLRAKDAGPCGGSTRPPSPGLSPGYVRAPEPHRCAAQAPADFNGSDDQAGLLELTLSTAAVASWVTLPAGVPPA
jgi:hypothetical protein